MSYSHSSFDFLDLRTNPQLAQDNVLLHSDILELDKTVWVVTAVRKCKGGGGGNLCHCKIILINRSPGSLTHVMQVASRSAEEQSCQRSVLTQICRYSSRTVPPQSEYSLPICEPSPPRILHVYH